MAVHKHLLIFNFYIPHKVFLISHFMLLSPFLLILLNLTLLCKADLGWLPDAHPAAVSLSFLNRAGGENGMVNLLA